MASTRRFPVSYFELLLAAGIVAPHGLLSAEKAAPEKTKPESAIVWHDCKDIGVEGKGWTGTGAPYDRLPAKAEGKVPKQDWQLGHHSAGLCVRFLTDAPSLQIRWTVVDSDLAMAHMPATGVSGLDLYAKDKAGRWQFVHNCRPYSVSNTSTCTLPPSEEFLLYLPLYNGVKSVEIGVAKGRTLAKPETAAINRRKSIVFYGTSITQGGCASRPGMAFPAIVGRRLDATIINLGFSGSGRMEPEWADLLAQIDPTVYVLDTLGNMSVEQVSERVGPFVKRLRRARPNTPILLVEDASLKAISPTDKGRALRAAFEKLTSEGVKDLHFLSNQGMLGDDGEGTVDGIHPNDLGMMRHADVFTKALRPLLQGAQRQDGSSNVEDRPGRQVRAGRLDLPDGDMMKRHLRRQVELATQRWEAEYEARTTPKQIAAWQRQCRARLWQVLGAQPERTPLNARTTGKVQRAGYVIEKVIFESQPGFHVTALLFLPEKAEFKPPYAGVVVPVGHTGNGKAWDEYQAMGALLALNGMAGLVYDAIDESERLQYGNERGPFVFDKMWGRELHGTYGHMMIGVGSILVGRNTAWFEVLDTIRAIDYLQSRSEVDPRRIGCTGHSGGGIITAYVLALDDRVQAAAPSGFLSSLPTQIETGGCQDAEQQTWTALTAGPQPTDFLMLRAPLPTLVCAATKDQYFDIRGAWRTIRCAKRLYTRLGAPERIEILETDGPHNYNRIQREVIARWMSRWLLGKDRSIVEPPIKLLTEHEAQCTPEGQVMRLPDARSAYDINEDYERELAKRREAAWANKDLTALLERVRQIAGIRRLDQLPPPKVEYFAGPAVAGGAIVVRALARGEPAVAATPDRAKAGTTERPGYRIEKLELRPEEGIVLPALLFVPGKAASGRIVLYVHERGKEADAAPGGRIEQLVLGGACVLAVDLRGTGETQPAGLSAYGLIGTDWKDISTAYCLGRSYVGMRAEDILIAARYAAKHLPGGPVDAVDLVAVGNVGVPALHAAALEPAWFRSVKLSQTLVSWASVVHCRLTSLQYVNAVHGALLEYDLPNLAATLGDKLTVEDPRDGAGKPIARR